MPPSEKVPSARESARVENDAANLANDHYEGAMTAFGEATCLGCASARACAGGRAGCAQPSAPCASNSLIDACRHARRPGGGPVMWSALSAALTLAPLSRSSLTTATWQSRWSQLPPFAVATMSGVLPFVGAVDPGAVVEQKLHGADLPSGVIFKRHLLDGACRAVSPTLFTAFGSNPRLRRSPSASTSPDVMAAHRSSAGLS
jgi:hypothetical protein